ncbi:MAG: hypothetical protein ACREYF_03350, partial [Gammaproteobacteria bacterium]
VDAVVLILDELPPDPKTGMETQVWKLAKQLSELSREWRDGWPDFGLIVLPLPGWDNRSNPPDLPGRVLEKREALKAFSSAETAALVHKLFSGAQGWTYETGATERLFFLSGGIPNLVQKLGYEACQKCIDVNPKAQPYHLEAGHVDAVVHNEQLRVNVHGTLTDWGLKHTLLERVTETRRMYLKGVLEALSSLSEAVVSDGLPEREWRSKVTARNSTRQFGETLNEVWQQLKCDEILIARSGSERYSFCAEVIRMHLGTLFDQ